MFIKFLLRMQISNESPSRDDVISEVEVLQEIRHRNIVQFFGATSDHKHVNMFMELMEGSVHAD